MDKLPFIEWSKEIRIPIGYLITFIMLVVSAAASYGSYRSTTDEMSRKIATLEERTNSQQVVLINGTAELARIRQSVEDLRETVRDGFERTNNNRARIQEFKQ